MFHLTRRHTVDHAPAFPNPSLRFPDGTPVPIHAGEEHAANPAEPPAPDESGRHPPG